MRMNSSKNRHSPHGQYGGRPRGYHDTDPLQRRSSPKGRDYKRLAIRLAVLLAAVGAMFALSLAVVLLLEGHGAGGPGSAPSSSLPAGTASLPSSAPAASAVPQSGSSVAASASEIPPDTGTPPRIAYAQPANGLIDMAYFDNVTFVGDSITQGLQLYASGIPNAHYCAYKNIGPKGIYDGSIWAKADGSQEVPLDAIVASQPDNVYILIGANAIVSMDDASFLAYYNEMVDTIKAALHPEVSIYIQSITPVVQGVDERFDMARINSLNDALATMAHEKGMHFINLGEVLAGDDGWLKPEYGAADGYHLTPDGYAVWVDYLRRHTASHRRHNHLYVEG